MSGIDESRWNDFERERWGNKELIVSDTHNGKIWNGESLSEWDKLRAENDSMREAARLDMQANVHLSRQVVELMNENTRLRSALLASRWEHSEYCQSRNITPSGWCWCNADIHNARIDEALGIKHE